MKRNTLNILTLLVTLILAVPAAGQVDTFGKTLKPVDNCQSKYGEGQDSIECVKNVSLYRESYKNWRRSNDNAYLADAFGSWKKAMFGCPCATKNIYIDGEKMLSYIIENPSDPIVKEKWYSYPGRSADEIRLAWVDTLMIMFDRRIEAYGQPCYVNGRKGVNLLNYDPSRFEEAYLALKAAVECREDESSARTLFEYFKATVMMVENGKLDTTEMLDIYESVTEACKGNLDDPKYGAIYSLTLDEINKAAMDYLTCEVLIPSYKAKFEANKDDVEFLKKVVKMLDGQGCTDNETFRKAARRLYELSPDSTAAFALAKMEYSLKNYTACIKYLNDAAAAFKSPRTLENIYLVMADSYAKQDRYPDARNAANKALENNPNNGQAYILIGDLYANSASSCKYKDMIVAYWVAYDAYAQAKSVDPSVADVASGKMAAMSSRFPLKSDIFFRSLTVGSSFTVECWINRSTTVRSSD